MSVTVELPKSLVTELWAWYIPKDKFAPIGDVKVSHPGKCHDLKSCFYSVEDYKESYTSIRAMKDLRRKVSSLASAIDNSIEKVEKQLLPMSRQRGIRLLPAETMIAIMNLVAICIEHDPRLFERTMRAFLDIPPFDKYVINAKALQKKWWAHRDSVWDGHLPRNTRRMPLSSITAFHFSIKNSFTLSAIRKSFRSLEALEFLSVTCCFDFDKITEGDDSPRSVSFPRLRTLDVSNLAQESDIHDDKRASEPLRRLIDMLDMPSLLHISARIVSFPFLLTLEETPFIWIETVNSIFAFGSRSFDTVRGFNIQDLRLHGSTVRAFLALTLLFSSCPKLTALSLCFHVRTMPLLSIVQRHNLPLKYLALNFGSDFDAEELHKRVTKVAQQIKKLKEKTALQELQVTAKHVDAAIVDILSNIHPEICSCWVTDRSILE